MMNTDRIYGYLLAALLILIGVSCDAINTGTSPGNIDWEDGEQIVPAEDSHLDEEVQATYREDAEKLAVRHINEKDPTQTEIPDALISLLYNALIHIENDEHPKAVEVTDTYEVHARIPVNPRQILVFADTTAPWIDAWRNEQTETGDAEIDGLIEEFNFELVEYNELANTLPTGMATLRSDRAINGYAVGKLFEEINHIDTAGPDGVTDGSEISVLFFDDRLYFTFDYGFGDCPAGCINRHQWHFNVFKDGTVAFVDEEGDPLPTGN